MGRSFGDAVDAQRGALALPKGVEELFHRWPEQDRSRVYTIAAHTLRHNGALARELCIIQDMIGKGTQKRDKGEVWFLLVKMLEERELKFDHVLTLMGQNIGFDVVAIVRFQAFNERRIAFSGPKGSIEVFCNRRI